MYVDEGEVNVLYPKMIQQIMMFGAEVVPRGDRTKELHPALMMVHNPRRRLVTSYGRPVNVPFMLAEVLWILQGRDDVAMLQHYNSNIASYSDDGEKFNAAYGARLRRSFGHDQLEDVIRTLEDDPDTRQATIVLSDPVDDRGWMSSNPGWAAGLDVKHVTKDRACNVLAHLMIRNGALDWYQVIRSNDALWGVPYNYMQWTHLQEYVAHRLGVEVGCFIHNVDSLHVYERQWKEARLIAPFDLYEYFEYDHAVMRTDPAALEALYHFETILRVDGEDAAKAPSASLVGEYWHSVSLVLTAYWLYKNGEDAACLDVLLLPGMDPVFGAATARFFFYNRWHKVDYTDLTMRLQNEWAEDLFGWVVADHA